MSTVSGSLPASPMIIAISVWWPLPVRGEGSRRRRRDDFAHLGQQAARDQVVSELFARFLIGPTVWSWKGPMSILKDIEYADHMYSRAVGVAPP